MTPSIEDIHKTLLSMEQHSIPLSEVVTKMHNEYGMTRQDTLKALDQLWKSKKVGAHHGVNQLIVTI